MGLSIPILDAYPLFFPCFFPTHAISHHALLTAYFLFSGLTPTPPARTTMLEGGWETGTDGRTAGLPATDGLDGSACGVLPRWMLMATTKATTTTEDINRIFLFKDFSHELLFYRPRINSGLNCTLENCCRLPPPPSSFILS